MDETVTGKLVAYLREHDAAIELLTHAPVSTSEEAARVRGTPLEQGAKALVCRADGRPVLLVVPANRRVDARAFKRVFGVKDLRMVSADELAALTGLEVGAVPPFGALLGLPTYVDALLLDCPRIAFNAGSRSVSITMATPDYARLAQATVGRFASEAQSEQTP
jgi:Ala-tRNA(Pro) deacylase